jgi:hypothetical protein
MPNLLDAHQIEAAIQAVDEHWTEPMLPREREEWTDALTYVFEGELRPVLERWATSTRPSAGAVLDYIVTNRERRVVVPKEPPAPDLGGKYTPVVVESIELARDALRRSFERRLVSCSQDPQ